MGHRLFYATNEESQNLLREAYKGECISHSGGRKLSQRVMCQRYYWPTILADSIKYSQMYDKCHRFTLFTNIPHVPIIGMASPYPVYKWGLDIVRLVPLILGQKKFILVEKIYFSKWIKNEALRRRDFRFLVEEHCVLVQSTQKYCHR